MSKYRRIEIHAYRRRVTVVSGAWRPDQLFEPAAALDDDSVSLNDAIADEPVEPDSPEGQRILAEAVRTLERRLSPETRATVGRATVTGTLTRANQIVLFRRLQAFLQLIWPKSLRAKG